MVASFAPIDPAATGKTGFRDFTGHVIAPEASD